ncbi:hypothetical protein HCUR_00590 [Holospora curviuscula]|uniref:Uncharacterized protein n=1 Tax=Holospora curviuscula TaxID=1082868 RepID=A0A2S5RAA6_9PROT|nr:hypothetical protein HCUR_00590 [Holospora curviuscula]
MLKIKNIKREKRALSYLNVRIAFIYRTLKRLEFSDKKPLPLGGL